MNDKKQFDVIVYIGRMQPPTRAHAANVQKAMELASQVIVLFGSSYQPRTIKNPWTWTERATMLFNQLPPAATARVKCRAIHDFRYNDQEWVQQIQAIVKKEVIGFDKPRVGIIGCKKDSSSYYLDLFPQWKLIEMDHLEDINATTVREQYFTNSLFAWKDKPLISPELEQYLRKWSECDEYKKLCKEYEFIEKYKAAWAVAPYPPTFVTVDGAVIQSGHILLVQRKAAPGEGLWALPGGFVDQNEQLLPAVLRELREETKLKVPTAVMAGSIVGRQVFDHPGRSLRGRTITHAFAFQLPAGELPKVKGGDDAKKARWFPIADALDMEEHLFEDHVELVRWSVNACQGK